VAAVLEAEINPTPASNNYDLPTPLDDTGLVLQYLDALRLGMPLPPAVAAYRKALLACNQPLSGCSIPFTVGQDGPDGQTAAATKSRRRLHRLPLGRAPQGARVATVSCDIASALHWRWWIGYDAAKKADHAATMQGAADAANEAWPKMKEVAARLAEIAAEEERLRTDVLRMCAIARPCFVIDLSAGRR
jgi:hypothetical protein